ncbi:hypothetical protein C4E24_05155 [ANME-1 cluster archaeon AG-394-G21]|nr:hypothetical protein [ANME-1 cluster archaeon AG-394-G21]
MFYNVERDFDQEVRYIASFMGKLLEVDSQVKEKIWQYVALKGLHLEMQSAVVMWWVRGNNLGKAVFYWQGYSDHYCDMRQHARTLPPDTGTKCGVAVDSSGYLQKQV